MVKLYTYQARNIIPELRETEVVNHGVIFST